MSDEQWADLLGKAARAIAESDGELLCNDHYRAAAKVLEIVRAEIEA